jgi:hypothetical protein
MIYRATKGQTTYGEYIGIMLMDIFMPFPPGCPANASTFSFPVKYKVVKGANMERLVYQKEKDLLPLFIDAGWELVHEGVKAITGNCGFMILYQEDLAKELPVPVFMSSLLQLQFISRMLKPKEKIGIITTLSNKLTPEMLKVATGGAAIPIKVTGMEDKKHFVEVVHQEKGVMDFERMQTEVIEVARNLVKNDDMVKAILLECTDLPPFAAAVQKEINLPIFDYTTMVNFVFSAFARTKFKGFF